MAGDLNSRIGFVHAAKALGIRLTSHSLPAQGNCPVCISGRLTFYQDTNQGGPWAHCRSCEFTGDMIDLGKVCWKCNTSVAVSEFQNKGALPLSRKTGEWTAAWEKQNRLVKGIQSLNEKAFRGGRVVTDSGARMVMNTAGMSMEMSMSWAPGSFGKLIGYATGSEIEDAFRPRKDTSPKRSVPRPQRITPSNSHASLIIPFYDLPGRIGSATFISVEGKSPCRFQDHYVTLSGGTRPCAGIAYHPDTFSRSGDNRLLLTSDVEVYARMHIRNFNGSPKTLPLVCYREGENPTDNWQMFSKRQFTLWGQTITPHMLWLAINHEAEITTYGSRGRPFAEYIRTVCPRDLVTKCFSHAKPWPAALAALVERKDAFELADFLGQMCLNDSERDRVVSACDKRMRDKLQQAFSQSVEYRTVAVSDGYVEQRASGWYYVRPGRGEQLITNAPFRVTEAIHGPTGIDYNVVAVVNNQPFSFQVPQAEFASQTLEIVRDKAIELGCGVPTFDPTWQRRALHIAKQMHAPVARRKITRVGYDSQTDAIALPFLRIDVATGRLSSDVTGDDKQPGAILRDTFLDEVNLKRMLANHDAVTPMCVLLGVTAQIMADMADVPMPTMGILGKSARRAASHVSDALGLSTSKSINPRVLTEQAEAHAWPFAAGIHQPLSVGARQRLLEMAVDSPLVIPVNETQMLYGQLTGRMVTVQSAGYAGLPVEQLNTIGPMFVQMLGFMCRGNHQGLINDVKGPAYGAYRLLCAYLKSIDMPHSILASAARRCRPSHNASQELARTVATLVYRGQMSLSNNAKDMRLGANIELPGRKAIAVNARAMLRCLRDGHAPVLDQDDFTIRLANAATPCGVEYIGGEYAWILDRKQYDIARRSITIGRSRLRIISA